MAVQKKPVAEGIWVRAVLMDAGVGRIPRLVCRWWLILTVPTHRCRKMSFSWTILTFLSCPHLCTDDTILHKNLTNTLHMLKPLYSHYTLLHDSALKGPSSGSTDTYCEQGQHNVSLLTGMDPW